MPVTNEDVAPCRRAGRLLYDIRVSRKSGYRSAGKEQVLRRVTFQWASRWDELRPILTYPTGRTLELRYTSYDVISATEVTA